MSFNLELARQVACAVQIGVSPEGEAGYEQGLEASFAQIALFLSQR
jgi:hypothetical protein